MKLTDPTEGFTDEQEALKLKVIQQVEDFLIIINGVVRPGPSTYGFVAQMKGLWFEVRQLFDSTFDPERTKWKWKCYENLGNTIHFSAMGPTYDYIGCFAFSDSNTLIIFFSSYSPEDEAELVGRFRMSTKNMKGLSYHTLTDKRGKVRQYAILEFEPVAA